MIFVRYFDIVSCCFTYFMDVFTLKRNDDFVEWFGMTLKMNKSVWDWELWAKLRVKLGYRGAFLKNMRETQKLLRNNVVKLPVMNISKYLVLRDLSW